ncbi:MAG TPA: GNAT family N-acetyltransferase [Acidimicrobiales bacterium]|nr:GNAT family N-acetyltransferase [Acidimicrobiales bacterium]
MTDVVTLVTPRLVLRPWRDDDRAPFAEMNADPAVMEFLPHPLTFVESNEFVERITDAWQRGFGLWAVEARDTGSFIGYAGFAQPDWSAHFTPCIEIGWRLRSESWGHGFATEAASAALAWGRGHVEFPRGEVVSFTTVANSRSRRVMEKLGFTHDESDNFDHPMLADGPLRRHVLYRRRIDA